MKTMRDRAEEVRLFIEYAAPPEHRRESLALVERYETDPVALGLLHAFYSFLPEAREDGIRELRLLARRQGNFLIAALTFHTGYYYLANTAQAEFLGELGDGIWEDEVLDYFGFTSRNELNAKHRDLSGFPIYASLQGQPGLCPVCSAAAGEEHTLGCPVEVCPWCGGQLTRCNCRFLQLGKARLDQEAHIEALAGKLREKGRIPYEPDQRPGYPKAGEGEAEG
ncbi:MAG: hypothetical protein M0017_11300 [Desulfobacteraceae bacterium]|nr:hypothetical protein [Desulfobacteraceae bacterium]